MVIYLTCQDDDRKFNYEIQKIKIQQEQQAHQRYVYFDKNNGQKWGNIGGHDEYDMHQIRMVSENFVKGLLKEAKDFAVSSYKDYIPPMQTWILKIFNKNEILKQYQLVLKNQKYNKWLATYGNKWDSDDLGQLQIKGTLLRHRENNDSTDEDEQFKQYLYIWTKIENLQQRITELQTQAPNGQQGAIKSQLEEIENLKTKLVLTDREKYKYVKEMKKKFEASNQYERENLKASFNTQIGILNQEINDYKNQLAQKEAQINDLIVKYQQMEKGYRDGQIGAEEVASKNIYDVLVRTKNRQGSARKLL